MRTDFWKGIVAGGVIGAVVSKMAGGRMFRKSGAGRLFAKTAGERTTRIWKDFFQR